MLMKLTRMQKVGAGLGIIFAAAVLGGQLSPNSRPSESATPSMPVSYTKAPERKAIWRETQLGSRYKIYDTCDISHDRLVYVRVPMAISELQRFMQCDGEELSQTVVTGIRQKVLLFRGNDPKDSFAAVVQNQRVMHVQRGM